MALLEKVLHRNMQYSNDMPAVFETTSSDEYERAETELSDVSLPTGGGDPMPCQLAWIVDAADSCPPPQPASPIPSSPKLSTYNSEDDDIPIPLPNATTPCTPRELGIKIAESHLNSVLQKLPLERYDVEEDAIPVPIPIGNAVSFWGRILSQAEPEQEPLPLQSSDVLGHISALPLDCLGVVGAFLTMKETLKVQGVSQRFYGALSVDRIWGRYFEECFCTNGEQSIEDFAKQTREGLLLHDLVSPRSDVVCAWEGGEHPVSQYTEFARPVKLSKLRSMPTTEFKSAFLEEQNALQEAVSEVMKTRQIGKRRTPRVFSNESIRDCAEVDADRAKKKSGWRRLCCFLG